MILFLWNITGGWVDLWLTGWGGRPLTRPGCEVSFQSLGISSDDHFTACKCNENMEFPTLFKTSFKGLGFVVWRLSECLAYVRTSFNPRIGKQRKQQQGLEIAQKVEHRSSMYGVLILIHSALGSLGPLSVCSHSWCLDRGKGVPWGVRSNLGRLTALSLVPKKQNRKTLKNFRMEKKKPSEWAGPQR